MLDAGELNTDFGMELCDDFATEIINTYMPEHVPWCERGPGERTPPMLWDQIKDRVQKIDAEIFKAIKGSNLYPEISKAFDPDLAIGTVALWIERPRPDCPAVVSTVPIRELEINLGPFGEIDDRWAVRYVRNKYVQAMLEPDVWAKVPKAVLDLINEKPLNRTEVRWGFWRIWEDLSDETWQHVVFVGDVMIHDCVIKGAGCCPLLVMRWAPNPDWPWGHGPLLRGLPSLRQVDELEYMRVVHADITAQPPIVFPDDSFAAVEQGLEPGMAYPIRVGSEGAIKPIYQPPPFDAANYAYQQKELRLRRMFYVDFPQQSGDTPPTLGQWLDEMSRAQRRIGRPGLPFWREGPAQIFVRFQYLLERAGYIQEIKIDGKNITLMPRNPTQRAAEQQDISTASQALQIAANFFPEEFKASVDGHTTMTNIFEKMRVTSMIKFRDDDDVKSAVDMISKLAQGTPAGAQGAAPQQQG